MKPSESVAWLAIEGWCTPEEGDALCEAATNLDSNGWAVDIGTYQGKSAIAMAMGGIFVTTIDSRPVEHMTDTMRACNVELSFYTADSRQVGTRWEAAIDMLYIDGWHDSENVRADYAAWAPHVVPGGLIWFHDAHGAGWPDVTALVDELVSKGELIFDGHVGTIAKCRKAGA